MNQHEVFEYNLPLQAYRQDNGDIQLINYMPRKNSCCEINLSEFNINFENKKEVKDFLYEVAINLLNLSILFVEFADGKRDVISYHNEDIEKHFYPVPYEVLVNKFLRTIKEK